MKTLREWRAERLLGIKTLARKAGVANTTIIGIEHGEQVAMFRTIRRLSDALEVDPKEVREFADAIRRRGSPTRSREGAQPPSDRGGAHEQEG